MAGSSGPRGAGYSVSAGPSGPFARGGLIWPLWRVLQVREERAILCQRALLAPLRVAGSSGPCGGFFRWRWVTRIAELGFNSFIARFARSGNGLNPSGTVKVFQHSLSGAANEGILSCWWWGGVCLLICGCGMSIDLTVLVHLTRPNIAQGILCFFRVLTLEYSM